MRTSVVIFIDWIANVSPPLAYYCSFVSGHLIVLEKNSGICLVGVEETCRRLFSECVLRVMGPKATSTFQDYQLCDRLKAVIDRAVHGFQAILDTKYTT